MQALQTTTITMTKIKETITSHPQSMFWILTVNNNNLNNQYKHRPKALTNTQAGIQTNFKTKGKGSQILTITINSRTITVILGHNKVQTKGLKITILIYIMVSLGFVGMTQL